MRIALITTTIYVPHVLARYRALNPDVFFIVVGDRKTPHEQVRALTQQLGQAVYYSDTEQEALGYASSALIGWNKIMRRNIALLEAIKWGADIIVSIDDDNLPLTNDYFARFEALLSEPYHGLQASTTTGWFNAGELLIPHVYHRGFPYAHRRQGTELRLSTVSNRRIGIAAGLWLGDPDIDAMERITNAPIVHQVSEVLQGGGVVVDPTHFAPVNSQNTAYLAALAPLMMVLVGVGRYDDIWASYIAERVMRETPYSVHFGLPLVWQQRNPQNPWRNLKDEVFGMEHTIQFCQDLLNAKLDPTDSVLNNLERLYRHLRTVEYLPPIVCELGQAWCDDVRTAMQQAPSGSERAVRTSEYVEETTR